MERAKRVAVAPRDRSDTMVMVVLRHAVSGHGRVADALSCHMIHVSRPAQVESRRISQCTDEGGPVAAWAMLCKVPMLGEHLMCEGRQGVDVAADRGV